MSRRMIPCTVSDEYVRGAGAVVGAAGSHNDVALRLEFGPMWAGTARSIVWRDALGGNPTVTILTTDMLEADQGEVYIVPIPAEPKAYAGEMRMTIKGAVVEGDVETSATLTATAFFVVMESDWAEDAAESGDITPTQAEQIQAEIEAIKADIVASTTAAAAAQASAEAAAASEQTAGTHAESADNSAKLAALSAQRAANSATEAAQSKTAAAESAHFAELSASDAAVSEQNAEASNQAAAKSQAAAALSEQNAAASEESVALDAQNAAQSAAAAGQSATQAATSAANAEACKAAAAASQQAAATSETQAEYWAKQAEAAAGGDFATKQEAQKYVSDHNTDEEAHADLREEVAGKVDKTAGTQTFALGRDAGGLYFEY